MARVLLVNPPHPEAKGFTREGRCTQESGIWATQWPPITLATAAAYLERDGHRVRVMDCPAVRMGRDGLRALIQGFQPDRVIWSTGTPTLDADLSLGPVIKAAAPDALTGVFGTHVTVFAEAALTYPGIDAVIRHEPEITLREICRHPPGRWEGIEGLSHVSGKTDVICHHPNREWIDPETLLPPAWHYTDRTLYRLPLKGRPFLMVAPIRGCPYPCTFCTAPLYYGKRLRKRPVTQVVDEIAHNVARFSIRDFFVWADTFTAEAGYVEDFSRELLARNLRMAWTCNSRVDTVNREMLALMKAAGLWMISFGIESGSDAVLAGTRKGITVEQARKAVQQAHGCGIRTAGHFIMGLPGETEQTLAQTLELALRLPLDIAQFYAAAPFPGTQLHEEAAENGWLRGKPGMSQTRAVLDLPGLPAERVDAFIRYAYRRFYRRPKTVQNLITLFRPAALGHMAEDLMRVRGRLKGKGASWALS